MPILLSYSFPATLSTLLVSKIDCHTCQLLLGDWTPYQETSQKIMNVCGFLAAGWLTNCTLRTTFRCWRRTQTPKMTTGLRSRTLAMLWPSGGEKRVKNSWRARTDDSTLETRSNSHTHDSVYICK